MKKRFIYIIASLLFVFATGFIILKSEIHRINKQSVPIAIGISELLSRNAVISQMEEWKLVKTKFEAIQKRIKENPSDIKSLLALTSLYIQEGRASGNLSYYNEAAMKCVNEILKKDPGNFEGLTFKSMILLSQHRFDEGLVVARQIQKINPYNAFVYGLLVDANVELGNYPAALEAADKMVSIRPDLRSYSRIAYLREIYGDLTGAINAMKMAVDAGVPGDENTEWCRVQLAKLYEQAGRIKDAEMHYTIAGNNRPNYPYAKAGLARIAVAEKNYLKALSLYQQADSLIPDHTFKEGMAEVYKLTGQPGKAKAIADEILEYMKKLSRNKKTGQNEDHEMAHAYMGVGEYDKALEYALLEYNRRPGNIEMNETVATIYAVKGDYAKALPYINAALKTNCKKPELLCLAGKIYAKSGDKEKAKLKLQEALKNKPLIAESLKAETEALLKSL